jgi:hypothetical protein
MKKTLFILLLLPLFSNAQQIIQGKLYYFNPKDSAKYRDNTGDSSLIMIDRATGRLYRTTASGIPGLGSSFTTDGEVDNIAKYNWTFPPTSFTDSTLINTNAYSSFWFDRGLKLQNNQTSIKTSHLRFYNYGYLVSEKWVQRLIFRVLDSSSVLSIGLGVKNSGLANVASPRDQYAYISGIINDSISTSLLITQENSGGTTARSGVLINRGDYIELTFSHNQDSNIVTYRNITTNNTVRVVKKINPLASGASNRMGYPTIYFNKGHVQLIDFTLFKPTDFDYIFIGNSTTWGHSVDSIKKTWVNQLQVQTASKINNTSKSAGTTYDYLSVKEDLNFRNKTVFLSGIMSVDPVGGRTNPQIKLDYDSLVRKIRANNNRIIHIDAPFRATFFGVGGWAQIDSLNKWLDTAYYGIDTVIHTSITGADLYTDNIHPNVSGHNKIAKQVLEKVPWLFPIKPVLQLHSMTGAQRLAISSPATGLAVYQTDGDSVHVKRSDTWRSLRFIDNGRFENNSSTTLTLYDTRNYVSPIPIGPGINFKANRSISGETSIAYIQSVLSDTSDANAKGDLIIGTLDQAVDQNTERLRIKYDGKVGIGTSIPTEKLQVVGNIVASAPTYSSGGYDGLVRNQTSGRFESIPLAAGTYTPTITGITNVTSTTASPLQYMRVGNTVTVSGKVEVDANAGSATLTQFDISLPFASDFTTDGQAGGGGGDGNGSVTSWCVAYANTTDNRIRIDYLSSTTSPVFIFFSFTYQIL